MNAAKVVSRPSLSTSKFVGATAARPSRRTFVRACAASSGARDFGDPLDERIYLEESKSDIVNPEPVPVIHSAAFLQRKRGVWHEQDSGPESTSSRDKPGASSGVEYFLNSVDEKLNTVEDAPPRVAEAFSEAISSEAGKNVREGMVQAAKLTVDAGVVVAKGAAKGAVPVMSWVVKNGTKAIISSATSSPEKKRKGGKN
jgi:hypothetical protein